MRTNIDLSDELMAEAGRHARGKTKTAIVEEVRRRSCGERLRALETRTASPALRTSPAELLRADRDG
jgi:Arc/MetJ family transcription regulator